MNENFESAVQWPLPKRGGGGEPEYLEKPPNNQSKNWYHILVVNIHHPNWGSNLHPLTLVINLFGSSHWTIGCRLQWPRIHYLKMTTFMEDTHHRRSWDIYILRSVAENVLKHQRNFTYDLKKDKLLRANGNGWLPIHLSTMPPSPPTPTVPRENEPKKITCTQEQNEVCCG